MAEIFVANGTVGNDMVEKQTNAPGQMTPILAISPPRSTELELENFVAKGEEDGLPIYFKLRDSNGDTLATSTSLQFEIEQAGSSSTHKVSKKVESIQTWNSFSLQEQRNADNVDAQKVVLTEPELLGGQPVDSIRWSHVQTVYVSVDAASEVDWSQSEFYIDSNAVVGPQ